MRTLKNLATGKLSNKGKEDWELKEETKDKEKTNKEKGKHAKTKENS